MNILNYQNYNEKELKEKSILDMMKDDYKTIKNFINEKRKYIFWIIVVFITMSFTDILSLGASWENICSQNPNFKLHKGGADNANTKGAGAGAGNANTKGAGAGNANTKGASNAGADTGTGTGTGTGAKAGNAGKAAKSKKGDGTGGMGRGSGGMGRGAGGVGVIGAFFGSGFSLIQKAFMIFATILLIAGALSLPFLLIIIVTYKIIKTVCGHFMMY